MRKVLVVVSVLLFGFGLVSSTLVFAKGKGEEQAREQVKKGTAAYNLGHFDEAARAYEEAYRLVQDPVLLFNIAQSYRLDRKAEKAIFSYRAFLRTAAPEDPNRALAEKRVAELQKQLEEDKAKKSAPTVTPLPADIRPTEPPAVTAERSPPLPLTAGAPLIPDPSASTPSSGASPAAILEASSPLEAPPESPIYKQWWFWTAMGTVVVAGTVTAIVLATGGSKPACSGEAASCVGIK